MEIPIFPLPMVLFPQVIVPLHIFEERYKEMVGGCIRDSRNFGLACILAGSHEDESTIRAVGVAARIVQSERLDDGRFNIMAAGEKRFRILRFTGQKPTGQLKWTTLKTMLKRTQNFRSLTGRRYAFTGM
jgi:Lon protease-like protein